MAYVNCFVSGCLLTLVFVLVGWYLQPNFMSLLDQTPQLLATSDTIDIPAPPPD
jgi:hypothetical protein